MPAPKNHIPKYRHHKATGRAYVELNGWPTYLGDYDSPQSHDRYNQLIAEWLANNRRVLDAHAADLTITELADGFLAHARAYYRRGDGRPTSEIANFKAALRPLLKLYSTTDAAAFGPLALKAVRGEMLRTRSRGRLWTRRTINKQIHRIRAVFRWGVENELVPATALHALTAVAPLRHGRTGAPEPAPIVPVPQEYVEAIERHVGRQVWAMVRLQLLTGMRPGEACAMRGVDIDTSGRVWTYTPREHKTQHHGHGRKIFLGPRAQELVRDFLKPDLSAPLFSPAEAEAERRAERHAKRRTPIGRGNRPGSNRKPRPRRTPGEQYTTASYRRAFGAGWRRR